MLMKVYWKSGAIECYETNSQGYKELEASCYYEDEEGIHLECDTLDKCTNRDVNQWEGNVPQKHVIVKAELLNEVDHITLDGSVVWMYVPEVERDLRREIIEHGYLLRAMMENQKETKKAFDGLRNADSVEDLFNTDEA